MAYTLQQHLDELERTDPKVAAAAQAYEDTKHSILMWGRINDRRAAEGKPPIGPYVRRSRSKLP